MFTVEINPNLKQMGIKVVLSCFNGLACYYDALDVALG